MHPKPKSAPGRVIQYKFVKNRTNAMKEIEAWVKKDADRKQEASRMSGQLTDNVTEDRMLKAKLWELSKERYKFLTQSAYEKKMFTDRIQRKPGGLLRRCSSAAISSAQNTTQRDSSAGKSHDKTRWRNARLALLERLDPTNKSKPKIKIEENKDEAKEKGKAEGAQAIMEAVKDKDTAEGAKAKKDTLNTKDKEKTKDAKINENGEAGSAKPRRRVLTASTPISIPSPSGRLVLEPLQYITTEAEESDKGQSLSLATGMRLRSQTARSNRSGISSSHNKFHKKAHVGKDDTDERNGNGGGAENVKKSHSRPLIQDPRESQRRFFLDNLQKQSKVNPGSSSVPVINSGGESVQSPGNIPNSGKPGSGVGSRPWSASVKSTTISNPGAADLVSVFGGRRGVLSSRFGMRLESKTKDPRYAQLEKSLAPIPEVHRHKKVPTGAPDVQDIVKNYEALHVPPRNKKEAKPKTEIKALEYIMEKGFVF